MTTLNITGRGQVTFRKEVFDPAQAILAVQTLMTAEKIAVTLPTLCEFVWALVQTYGFKLQDATGAIRALTPTAPP